ncbi:tetratricopeptide repeat protein [Geminocystis sp. NIES-3709]|uniref:tetratricopeptide repeat protein n=1 Tax=Geminocystis sp. NIES-3709 TaxID=1617448 RepID=UPI0005FC3C87|nr:tetratricopeptide repeat protein [Geminocystis sp. NIES-3709]BAQ65956.1 TPR domain protein [Geminocystis sp. NIES-3709]
MIKKLKQWLKQIPATIQAYDPLNDEDENHHDNEGNGSNTKTSSHKSLGSVKDSDLEFLFHQLLQGVANGWQENRIEQFFEKLTPRITVEIWLDWLQRYRNQLMASPAPHYHFAARMIILGEVTASLPFLRPVGDLAYEIGTELLNRRQNNPIVESLRSRLNQDTENDPDKDLELTESASSLGDVLSLLQNNPEFAENTAKELGINTVDPGMIMEKIVQETELESIPFKESPSPETINDLFNLGLEKAETGDLEEAIAFWDQVLSVDRKFTQAWHNRGSALAYLNRFEEAIHSFDQAIAINVNDYYSWNNRGNALYSLGKWQEAIISWDRVLGVQPNFLSAWYHKGLASEKLNLTSDAIVCYQKCLSIDPNHTLSRNALTRINT